MDLRDLRYFEAAAELGHLRLAAARVHRTQPALTKSIHRLEAELGAALFERVGRRIRLTEVGAVLLVRARSLRQAMDDTTREIREFASGAAGHVRVGASATAVEYLLPAITSALLKELPEVTLDVVVGMNDALCAALKAGEFDLVICPIAQVDPALAVHVIAKDPVVVVASSAHPLFRQRTIALADLCRYRWLLPTESIASRTWIDHAFERHGLPRPVAQVRSASISLTPRLVSGTQLLSFISRRNLGMARIGESLREIPLRATTMQRDFAILWRVDGYLGPAATRTRSLIEKRGREILDAATTPRGPRRRVAA